MQTSNISPSGSSSSIDPTTNDSANSREGGQHGVRGALAAASGSTAAHLVRYTPEASIPRGVNASSELPLANGIPNSSTPSDPIKLVILNRPISEVLGNKGFELISCGREITWKQAALSNRNFAYATYLPSFNAIHVSLDSSPTKDSVKIELSESDDPNRRVKKIEGFSSQISQLKTAQLRVLQYLDILRPEIVEEIVSALPGNS